MSGARVALVGYGKVARDLHRPAWQALAAAGRARVTTICESSADGARFARDHFPDAEVIRGDAAEVLAVVDCDVVDICTPGHTHAALTMQAVRRGLATIVEKPLCHTVAEADAILAAAGDVPVIVGQTLRLSPPARSFAHAHRTGRIGDVRRVQIVHHARHALSEAEWVTRTRPDGILFENAIHAVDLAYMMMGSRDPLRIDAAKFYETSHRRVLLGLEVLASDAAGRHLSLDFLQDSLTHSSFQSSVLVSATGADAELQFSPSGFRVMSGVLDPVSDIRAEAARLLDVGRDVARPARRSERHRLLFEDLLDACAAGRPTSIPPAAVRSTIATLEQLSQLWHDASPDKTDHPTSAAVGIVHGY
ncbi:MAG: Gfo/Idh/MocA family protein [Acidimicrobiales bacterium]